MPKIWVDSQGRIQIPRHIRELIAIKPMTYIEYDISNSFLVLKAKGGDKR